MKPNEMLSQEEIDALLSAVKSGTVAVSPGGDRADAKAVIYNFRRPSRVSKEQIRALQILHEDFAKVTTASLSGMLRTMVDLELEAVEQIPHGELRPAQEGPERQRALTQLPQHERAILRRRVAGVRGHPALPA